MTADLDYEESEEVQPVLLVDDPAFLKLDQSQMPLQVRQPPHPSFHTQAGAEADPRATLPWPPRAADVR